MLARFLRCFHNPATLCISVKFYYSCQEKMFFKLNELILENSCLNYDFYHLIALTLIKKLGSVGSKFLKVTLLKIIFPFCLFEDSKDNLS